MEGGIEDIALHDLSDELLVQVFARIENPPKIASCARLNRRFRAVLSDDALWRDIVLQATDGKQPPCNGVSLGLSGSDESYRQAYIRLMYDVSRLEITRNELINSTWRFYFISDMYLFHASPEQAAQRAGATGNPGHVAKFSETGFFSSNIAGAPSRRTPTRWQLLAINEGSEASDSEDCCPMASHAPSASEDDAAVAAQTQGGCDFGTIAERRRELCASASERRRAAGDGGEVEGQDDIRPDNTLSLPPTITHTGISQNMTNPMRPLSQSPLAHPLRSPSGDFPLLASPDYGSYVQV